MRTRLTTTLAASLLAVAMLAAPAAAHGDDGHDGHDDGWGPMGPHAHALLINATTVPNPGPGGPPVFPIAWDRCVDLAGGKALPKSNHHRGIHTGTAGTALRENAGHLVVPVDCATLEDMRSG